MNIDDELIMGSSKQRTGWAAGYLERPHRLLTAMNTGVALTLLVSGMLIGVTGAGVGVVVGAAIFAGLVVLFAQLVPRALARR